MSLKVVSKADMPVNEFIRKAGVQLRENKAKSISLAEMRAAVAKRYNLMPEKVDMAINDFLASDDELVLVGTRRGDKWGMRRRITEVIYYKSLPADASLNEDLVVRFYSKNELPITVRKVVDKEIRFSTRIASIK